MFEESVQSQQGFYDGVSREGQTLHRLAHPRAEPRLAGQLQQLDQKWKVLKGKIHSRSSALTSALLEVHGLQDSIDELSEWVASAEKDMSSAEGLPIGEDMESVEEQLNEHEVRMEGVWPVVWSKRGGKMGRRNIPIFLFWGKYFFSRFKRRWQNINPRWRP